MNSQRKLTIFIDRITLPTYNNTCYITTVMKEDIIPPLQRYIGGKCMKSYDLLFQAPFRQSQQIDDTFVDIANSKGLKAAINYLKQIGAQTLDMVNFIIKCRINEFTDSNYNQREKEENIRELLDLKDYIKKVEIINSEKLKLPQVLIETIEGTIKASQFSSINPDIKEIIPFIECSDRLGKCFKLTYLICLNLGIPNSIVTGYIYGYTDKSQFLHSWIETTINNEDVVIDGTLNVIMNKEGYYQMSHVEVLTRVSNETLIDDIKKYLSKLEKIPIEVYYLFRDEIIRDFNKNQAIFNYQKTLLKTENF